ncbi:hypothetical protein GUITHDRAFT_114043 [Guillardia theta CCMP2712]|uniref:Phosducin thioredoxin-like domain-containing protein n=1 Tax=Guillardia theta (strain CCMP2712) TaxID=905079 RepID=L1IUA5_GUITC|nr:hypothetical protein GUITHDRAFT_114043 [Guillardia theta CCMP2712]EKX39793.1 hypothetical protein GUITHDRAFT_114043 [Guillardia theta CCMP2712]|eukprot:XP_005826773.1 hypothetical protein GUITHDRAFT_114043 [Guillardia theta CCMP2712]
MGFLAMAMAMAMAMTIAAPVHVSCAEGIGAFNGIGVVTGDEWLSEPNDDPGFVQKKMMKTEYRCRFFDSSTESDLEHKQLRGEEPDLPDWYKHMQTKFRAQQDGKWWEKAAIPSYVDLLDSYRADHHKHKERLWQQICDKMQSLMDAGCGHNVPSFSDTRDQIYELMKTVSSLLFPIPPPRRCPNLTKFQKDQSAAKIQRKQELFARWAQDVISLVLISSTHARSRRRMQRQEEEAILRKIRKQKIRKQKKERRRKEFGSLLHISAMSFNREVLNEGRDVWVYVLLYDDGREDCIFLQDIFNELAASLPSAKFVKLHFLQALPDLHKATPGKEEPLLTPCLLDDGAPDDPPVPSRAAAASARRPPRPGRPMPRRGGTSDLP